MKDSFGRVDKGEVWIYGLHISPYQKEESLSPTRPRKILLKKKELVKLTGKVAERGLTLVPLKLYFDGNWAKIELGLAKAKKKYEKREAIQRKAVKREIEKALKGKTYGR